MLRQAINELEIRVSLEGESPVLIREGRYRKEEKDAWSNSTTSWPGSIFICRNPLDSGPKNIKQILLGGPRAYSDFEFYIPASSVRGAWRSHLEKILRSLDDRPIVCDPLILEGSQDSSCSSVLMQEGQSPPVYRYLGSCPVCRIFGDTAQASRLTISDGTIVAADRAVVTNVAIKRHTSTVQSPFKSLVLENLKASLTLRLHNFELWQVGLLGHLFQDLAAGSVLLGYGKNKGWGVVKAEAKSISITSFGAREVTAEGRLRGIGEVCGEQRRFYGFASSPELLPEIRSESLPERSALWRKVHRVVDIPAFWKALKPCFNSDLWSGFQSLVTREERAREQPTANQ